jgi:hypothetical protein
VRPATEPGRSGESGFGERLGDHLGDPAGHFRLEIHAAAAYRVPAECRPEESALPGLMVDFIMFATSGEAGPAAVTAIPGASNPT